MVESNRKSVSILILILILILYNSININTDINNLNKCENEIKNKINNAKEVVQIYRFVCPNILNDIKGILESNNIKNYDIDATTTEIKQGETVFIKVIFKKGFLEARTVNLYTVAK